MSYLKPFIIVLFIFQNFITISIFIVQNCHLTNYNILRIFASIEITIFLRTTGEIKKQKIQLF